MRTQGNKIEKTIIFSLSSSLLPPRHHLVSVKLHFSSILMKALRTDRPTDGSTDQPTNQPTDKASFRDADASKKKKEKRTRKKEKSENKKENNR